MKFVVCQDVLDEWRWTLQTDSGILIADSVVTFRPHFARNLRPDAPRHCNRTPVWVLSQDRIANEEKSKEEGNHA